MSEQTTRLELYKPGGGLSGTNLPDEYADIDKINGNMDLIDDAVGFFICTSSTRPTNPFPGQAILQTNDGNSYIWSGSEWAQLKAESEGPLSNVFKASSGWDLDYQVVERRGDVVIGKLRVIRTGGTISVPSHGDIVNQTVATFSRTEYAPPYSAQISGPLAGGRLCGGEISLGIGVRLNAVGGARDISNGDNISLGGTWFMPNR